MLERELIFEVKEIRQILRFGNFLLEMKKGRWSEILHGEFDFLVGI
jgi:hypothetical protein